MNSIRFGLYQKSQDLFALSIHADTEPTRLYFEFDAANLRASLVEREDEHINVELLFKDTATEKTYQMFFQRMQSEKAYLVEVGAGVMAMNTASDTWSMTLLKRDMPSYQVALAFSSIPLQATHITPEAIISIPYEKVSDKEQIASWRMLHPALIIQGAKIICPDVLTGADACALLANRPGILDYLIGLGDTFSLTDIETLAHLGQLEPSTVIAGARDILGESRPWLYKVQLSQRAINNKELFAINYARAKMRHTKGLHDHPIRESCSAQQLEFYTHQTEHYAHHLAFLQLCLEFGIGLWSCPMSGSERLSQWSIAISPERE